GREDHVVSGGHAVAVRWRGGAGDLRAHGTIELHRAVHGGGQELDDGAVCVSGRVFELGDGTGGGYVAGAGLDRCERRGPGRDTRCEFEVELGGESGEGGRCGAAVCDGRGRDHTAGSGWRARRRYAAEAGRAGDGADRWEGRGSAVCGRRAGADEWIAAGERGGSGGAGEWGGVGGVESWRSVRHRGGHSRGEVKSAGRRPALRDPRNHDEGCVRGIVVDGLLSLFEVR